MPQISEIDEYGSETDKTQFVKKFQRNDNDSDTDSDD